MKIYKITPAGFAANCYLLTADGKNAVAIDPAQPRVLDEAKKRGLQVNTVLLTHGHFDHIGGVSALQRAGARVGCLAAEKVLALGRDNMAEEFGCPVPPFSIDFCFADGEELSFDGIGLKVIATAGHTAGSCCFLSGDALFTGDTLFEGSVGRTDLPTGSGHALYQSVQKLYALAGDYVVYAGHGEETSLDYERKHNGYIKA